MQLLDYKIIKYVHIQKSDHYFKKSQNISPCMDIPAYISYYISKAKICLKNPKNIYYQKYNLWQKYPNYEKSLRWHQQKNTQPFLFPFSSWISQIAPNSANFMWSIIATRWASKSARKYWNITQCSIHSKFVWRMHAIHF